MVLLSPRRVTVVCSLLLSLAVLLGVQARSLDRVPVHTETAPAHGMKDAADDPAIWVNERTPSQSLVVATNKKSPVGGLQVFDLAGQEVQFLAVGPLNNADVRNGYILEGRQVPIIGATDRDTDAIRLFVIDPETGRVTSRGAVPTSRDGIYGFCLHHDRASGDFDAIATFESGAVQQYRLQVDDGQISGSLVREFNLSGTAEGCVVDDETGQLYITEEEIGLWRLAASGDKPAEPVLVDSTAGDRLEPDVEGVTIYDDGGGEGYLLVSSQGDSTYAVYDREPPNRYLGSFELLGRGSADAPSVTDGIAVTSAPLGPGYPLGLLVVHDQNNAGASTSNFKYVDWRAVRRETGL